ncbi:MAG TPA: biotin carboxylase N-terminal domain-containing protein [Rhizomicrobium sp.]
MRFRRVLIANRGEIALRVIATCERLGIETVLAASEADLDSVPARRADRVVRIGKAPSAQSYLDWRAIAAAAKACGADAVHPGYGFLSENAALARGCREAGIAFIGASEEQLAATGDKWRAREVAERAGLPVVPGAIVQSSEEARQVIDRIGCPALVKAVGGGGGRGMKRISRPEETDAVVALAVAEADAAFGDPRVYIERFVTTGRHVEVQLIGDGHRLVHAGERDCSVQRRYQKLIEETPAPQLSAALRERLHAAALAFGGALDYRGLGTVEFLVDAESDAFFFLEMNARIQVEHPITEAVTGLDLVAEQIAVAEGQALRLRQEDIRPLGHAVEFRINAEDPALDFRPSPGRVSACAFPAGPGIRIDSHIEAGADVPPYYDSLLAKLVVHAPDRDGALSLARTALRNVRIEGVATNIAMHQAILDSDAFGAGGVGTDWFAGFWQRTTAR